MRMFFRLTIFMLLFANVSASSNDGFLLDPLTEHSLTVGCHGMPEKHVGGLGAMERGLMVHEQTFKENGAPYDRLETPKALQAHHHPGRTLDLKPSEHEGHHTGDILSYAPTERFDTVFLEKLPPASYEPGENREVDLDFMRKVIRRVHDLLQDNGRLVICLAMDCTQVPAQYLAKDRANNPFLGLCSDVRAYQMRINNILGGQVSDVTKFEQAALDLHKQVIDRRIKELRAAIQKSDTKVTDFTKAWKQVCAMNMQSQKRYPLRTLFGQLMDPYQVIDTIVPLALYFQQAPLMKIFLEQAGFTDVTIGWLNEDQQPFTPDAGLFITARKASN